MAWAEQLPSGRWRGVFRDATGRRRSAGTFPHRAAALRAAGAAETEARTSLIDLDGRRMPWGTWCTLWWPTRTVAPSTARTDAIRRDKHLLPRWEEVPLGAIARHDVRAWAAKLRDDMSPATVRRCVHLLSASLTAALDAQLLVTNPAARLRLPPATPGMERFLTKEEYAAVREQLATTHDQLVADVLVLTGMRFGEVAGLHWHRVDLERATLRVVETYDSASRGIQPYPKGRRLRDLPLTSELVDALAQLRAETDVTEDCGLEHVAGRCRSGLVLATSLGGVVRNDRWATGWRRAVVAAGVGHARPHDLRHTYASWLLQGGVSLAEVGRLLGHVSPQTTARYAHLAETPREAVLTALAPVHSTPAQGPAPAMVVDLSLWRK